MWNRQREAEAAREKLALIEEESLPAAPNRNPPPVADAAPAEVEPEVPADAAE
jgi:ATP-binding cassette subfamily B protein